MIRTEPKFKLKSICQKCLIPLRQTLLRQIMIVFHCSTDVMLYILYYCVILFGSVKETKVSLCPSVRLWGTKFYKALNLYFSLVCLSQLSVNLFLTPYSTYEAKNTSSCYH